MTSPQVGQLTEAQSYRPEIDALRALAVIPVVLFHADASWVPSGYLGVDVFFVISGFLITGILLKEMRAESFKMSRFFARRIRRLGPVMLAVVATTLLVAVFRVTDYERRYLANQGICSLLSLANVFFYLFTGSYWGPQSENSALLHTWSLSVEEQFYLLFPPMLWFVFKKFPMRVARFLAVTTGASLMVYLAAMVFDPSAAFYLLPARAWELGVGALLALSQTSKRSHASGNPVGWAGLVGISMIILAYFLPSSRGEFSPAVFCAVGGATLYLSMNPTAMAARLIAWRPLVYVGLISYSWYMWHWPIMVLNDQAGLYASRPMVIGLGFIAAVLSFHFLEKPTRSRKGSLPYIGIAYVALLIGSFVLRTPKHQEPIELSQYEQPSWYGHYYSSKPADKTQGWYAKVIDNINVPDREVVGNEFENEGVRIGEADVPDILLLGDSHALMWANVVREIGEQRDLSMCFWAINGFPPDLIESEPDSKQTDDSISLRYSRARLNKLDQWHPRLTILAARWWYYPKERVESLVDTVASRSEQVLLVGQPPEFRIGDQSALHFLSRTGVAPRDDEKIYADSVRSEKALAGPRMMAGIAQQRDNVTYLPLRPLYEKGSQVIVLDGRHSVFLNDDHLTDFGAQIARPKFEEALDNLLH